MISFEYPIFLLLPIIIYICQKFCKKNINIEYIPNAKYFLNSDVKSFKLLVFLKWITIILIVIALSSPYSKIKNNDTRYGVNILIGLDVSGSMYDIFDTVKKSVLNFIDNRGDDNIGLILFAKNIMLASPMTNETKYVHKILSNVKLGVINGGGTAINDMLVSANQILSKADGVTKIIILFSDGEDTTSMYNQNEVYDKFKDKNMYRVYSLVYGAKNDFLYKLSNNTKGQYFNIKDIKNLSNVYNKISSLEKQLINNDAYFFKTYYFIYFIWLSIFTLLLYIIIKYEVIKR